MLVGDGPADPTGLGRIARDLAGLIVASDLPVEFVQIGGSVPPPWTAWRHFPLDRSDDWGAACTARYWQDLFGTQPGILFTVWDPGRLVDYANLDLPVQKWAYTAIDATNRNGVINGPAAAALSRFDRVLAYGRWGAEVLKATYGKEISYLPHGITPEVFAIPPSVEEYKWVAATLGPHVGTADVLGMVAANQPRKDFSIFFETLALLRHRGRHVYGWLHTDTPVKAWAVAQLVEDCGLQQRITLTLDQFTDRQLALLYQRCGCTMLTSLGEGFGYPIVESLASGTPVVSGECAGGRELLPKAAWKVPVRLQRTESVYALKRPVFLVEDWANAVERAMGWKATVGAEVAGAYCRGTVAHLDWAALWPRWRGWIRQGLEGR
jgi:glycosyltransferase involved in cell wall biosynthesis